MSVNQPRQSCLRAQLKAAGATFVLRQGTEISLAFTSREEESRTVRESAGVIDRTDRAFLAVAGPDAVRFLQGMVTNQVQELKAGQGNYACHLNAQGHIIADFHLLVMPDHILLETDAPRAEALRTSLEKYIIADDVEVADFSTKLMALQVEGPDSGRLLTAAGAGSLPAQDHAHTWTTLGGTPAILVRLSETGEEGYRVVFVPDNADSIWESLIAAKPEVSWKPVGYDVLNILRTEAGIPWYGYELTDKTLPPEARLEQRAIHYNKGCYLGQEIIERIRSRGNVHRLLTGFYLEGESLPAPGTKLLKDGKEVGWLTTVVFSPQLDRIIALGYIRREFADPGSKVETSEGTRTVTTELPFCRFNP